MFRNLLSVFGAAANREFGAARKNGDFDFHFIQPLGPERKKRQKRPVIFGFRSLPHGLRFSAAFFRFLRLRSVLLAIDVFPVFERDEGGSER